MGTTMASIFLKEMAQVPTSDGKGVSYYNIDDLEAIQAKALAAGTLAGSKMDVDDDESPERSAKRPKVGK